MGRIRRIVASTLRRTEQPLDTVLILLWATSCSQVPRSQNPHSDFESVPEMNAALIAGWNRHVGSKDTVDHFGDFALGPKILWAEDHQQLDGKIVLILGNRDAPLARFQEMLLPKDAWSTDYLYQSSSGLQMSLSHIPPDHDEVRPRDGRLLRSKSYPDVKPHLMFCGHVHERWRTHPATGCINVGVDVP